MPLNSHHFSGRPSLAQFAKEGAWESAWSFAPGALPSRSELDAYLSGATEVAFEVFFGHAFLGIRFDKRHHVKEHAWHCVAALRGAVDAGSFVVAFCRNSDLDLPFRLVSRVEVGAVNAWRSVRAFAIQPETLTGFEQLWGNLSSAPVAANTTHPKALEVSFDGSVEHWLAVPVSQAQPPYKLSQEALREASQIFTMIRD